ncbi:glucokinase [Halobacteriales archaeon QS_3_64_16]|nr:MAG: glucokinase [Halobacteriales archaeon QS_3_64_16]
MSAYAGVDLGATNIRAVVADADGTLLGSADHRTPRGPTGAAVTDELLAALREASEKGGVRPAAIESVGVGSIGPLDLATGVIENPSNLPAGIGVIPLRGPIANLADLSEEDVYLHNDTNAGCIGERFYADRNPDDMAYLTISSGIGAGVCVDGNVLGGWDGNAGEVGHMTVDPDGKRTCGCGKDGHWEAYCSGNNIPEYARDLYEQEPVETVLDVEGDLTAAAVFGAAREDDFAEYVIDRLAAWNTMGIANTVHAFAPLVVYIGGAVALNNPELTLEPIRERLDDLVFINVPEIELTTLGDDAVVRGALASALTEGTGDRHEFEE